MSSKPIFGEDDQLIWKEIAEKAAQKGVQRQSKGSIGGRPTQQSPESKSVTPRPLPAIPSNPPSKKPSAQKKIPEKTQAPAARADEIAAKKIQAPRPEVPEHKTADPKTSTRRPDVPEHLRSPRIAPFDTSASLPIPEIFPDDPVTPHPHSKSLPTKPTAQSSYRSKKIPLSEFAVPVEPLPLTPKQLEFKEKQLKYLKGMQIELVKELSKKIKETSEEIANKFYAPNSEVSLPKKFLAAKVAGKFNDANNEEDFNKCLLAITKVYSSRDFESLMKNARPPFEEIKRHYAHLVTLFEKISEKTFSAEDIRQVAEAKAIVEKYVLYAQAVERYIKAVNSLPTESGAKIDKKTKEDFKKILDHIIELNVPESFIDRKAVQKWLEIVKA